MSIETITLNKETYDSLVNSEKELEKVKHEFKVQANKLNEVNKKLTLVESGKYVVNTRHIIYKHFKVNLTDSQVDNLIYIINNGYNIQVRLSDYINNLSRKDRDDEIQIEDCKLITELVTERVKYLRTKLYPDLVEELEQRDTKIEELSKELIKVKNDLIDLKSKHRSVISQVDDVKKYLSNFPDLTEDKSIFYLKHKFINFRYNSSNKITAITNDRLKEIINRMYHTINDIVFRK